MSFFGFSKKIKNKQIALVIIAIALVILCCSYIYFNASLKYQRIIEYLVSINEDLTEPEKVVTLSEFIFSFAYKKMFALSIIIFGSIFLIIFSIPAKENNIINNFNK